MPIDTDTPLGQAAFDEAMCTFHWPSKVAPAAGFARIIEDNIIRLPAVMDFKMRFMTNPICLTGAASHSASVATVMVVTGTISTALCRKHDRVRRHAPTKQKAPPEWRGLVVRYARGFWCHSNRVQVWPPQNMPPNAQP